LKVDDISEEMIEEEPKQIQKEVEVVKKPFNSIAARNAVLFFLFNF